jgi:hypothetical protein
VGVESPLGYDLEDIASPTLTLNLGKKKVGGEIVKMEAANLQ